MKTTESHVDSPEVQNAIYGVALSFDAFLINGIQYGVLQRDAFPGFVDKTAGNLLRDLASLEDQVLHAPTASQREITKLVEGLRAKCTQLIELVTDLTAF